MTRGDYLFRFPVPHELKGSTMSTKTIKESLVDSALLIAILSAVCYVVGYFAELKMVRAYGIPQQVLADQRPEYLLTVGGVHVLLYSTIVLACYGAFLIGERKWPAMATTFNKSLSYRLQNYPYFYIPLFGISCVVAVALATLYLPLPRNITAYENSPTVVALDVSTGTVPFDSATTRLLSKRDGLIVLWDTREDSFTILRQEFVNRISVRAHQGPPQPSAETGRAVPGNRQ